MKMMIVSKDTRCLPWEVRVAIMIVATVNTSLEIAVIPVTADHPMHPILTNEAVTGNVTLDTQKEMAIVNMNHKIVE